MTPQARLAEIRARLIAPSSRYAAEQDVDWLLERVTSLEAACEQERKACNEYRNDANAKGTLLAEFVAAWDRSYPAVANFDDLIYEARRLVSGAPPDDRVKKLEATLRRISTRTECTSASHERDKMRKSGHSGEQWFEMALDEIGMWADAVLWELPTAAELTGSDPDFTGGITTQQHMDQIRGARSDQTREQGD